MPFILSCSLFLRCRCKETAAASGGETQPRLPEREGTVQGHVQQTETRRGAVSRGEDTETGLNGLIHDSAGTYVKLNELRVEGSGMFCLRAWIICSIWHLLVLKVPLAGLNV